MNASGFSRLKDAALEQAVLLLLRPWFQRYGEILSLRLDTSARLIHGQVRLHGDPAPLTVTEARYRLEQRGAGTMLIVHDVKVSREWAQNVLDDHFREIPVKVPEVLKLLLP